MGWVKENQWGISFYGHLFIILMNVSQFSSIDPVPKMKVFLKLGGLKLRALRNKLPEYLVNQVIRVNFTGLLICMPVVLF